MSFSREQQMSITACHADSDAGSRSPVTLSIAQAKKVSRKIIASQFAWATVIFLSFNIYLGVRDANEHFSPVESAAHSFDYSGLEKGPAFLADEPNVLLLGSSLLINPEWKIDRTLPTQSGWAKDTIQSASNYHLAQGLEKTLSQTGMKGPHVYSLAAGGALISDSYLLLSHYLALHSTPKVVVIDCAPRSFNDSGVIKPTSTVIFKHCFSMHDFFNLSHLYVRRFDERIDHVLERVCFVYHHRQWLSNSIAHYIGKRELSAGETIAAINGVDHPIPAENSKHSASSQLDRDQRAANTNNKLEKSIAEYKNRYWYTHHAALHEQMTFLERLSALCDSKDIKLVVLNMPLHKRNLRLLPAGFYKQFQQMLASAAGKRAMFRNLASLGVWTDEDYDDSVHLNEIGGAKLNTFIADAVIEAVH